MLIMALFETVETHCVPLLNYILHSYYYCSRSLSSVTVKTHANTIQML